MALIPLTKNKNAIVDDVDYASIEHYKWQCSGTGYASRREKSDTKSKYSVIHMHRLITNAPNGMDVDHINGNRLDNRRANLRVCTRSENMRNRGKNKNNATGFKGVCWDKQMNKFRAQIGINGKRKFLGLYDTAEGASRAYNSAAIMVHGEFSKTT